MTDLRIYGLVQDSIVDGPGLRYAVFVQGCSHVCPGCHNPDSQPASGGDVYSTDEIIADIRKNPLIHDVTLSGGEPFEQAEACAELAYKLKAEGYGVWTYTGYRYEDLAVRNDEHVQALLQHTDVLVDGPFVESLRSLELKWCGSSNQRLIDMSKTRASGTIVLWSQDAPTFEKPPSW